MRHRAKIDDNQPEIVKHLLAIGCSVQSLAATGSGCPDLLVGRGGVNYLLEIKDGSKEPARQKTTKAQEVWHRKWSGQVVIVKTIEQAEAVVIGRRL